ncbi:MAG: leucine-rich repeat domain-containing protein [Thermoguttaceae bacterium]|nr:leucine-rich repeat domain-containing protein [Thermoguttaceae bacterium]
MQTDDGVLFSKDGKTLVRRSETNAADVYFVPEGVESIGSGAFLNCASLKSIVMPEGVKTVGDFAFYGCCSLETVALPASLEKIGESAFLNNDALTSFDVADGNASFRSINGVLFSKDGKTLIKCPDAYVPISGYGASVYYVPDGVEEIGEKAFANCRRLEHIKLPAGVKRLGTDAFAGCSRLKSINCEPLDKFLFWQGGEVLFSNRGTVLVKCPPGIEKDSYVVDGRVAEIADGAFEDCVFLKTIEIKDGVEKIGFKAFAGCSSLESLILPDSVTTIPCDAVFFDSKLVVRARRGSYAERYAKENNLAFEPIPDEFDVASTFQLSVDGKILRGYVGKGKKATIPEGVEIVDRYVFDSSSINLSGMKPRGEFSSLKTIFVPKTVKQIDTDFSACRSLETIEVDEDNPYYRSIDGALYSKDGKTLIGVPARPGAEKFVVPDGVEVIGAYAFKSHNRLKTVVFPKSVKAIGNGAFTSCSLLEKIELPKNVEKIGLYAFSDCRKLERIAMPKSVKEIGVSVDDGSSPSSSPKIVEPIKKNNAFAGCDFLTIVAPRDSYAERYAKETLVNYEPPKWTSLF